MPALATYCRMVLGSLMIDLGRASTAETNFPIARYREATGWRGLVVSTRHTVRNMVDRETAEELVFPGAGEHTSCNALSKNTRINSTMCSGETHSYQLLFGLNVNADK